MELNVSQKVSLGKTSHVQLWCDELDQSSRHLLVSCRDQVGLLFKLCELLASHGIDIRSAEITTIDGIVNNSFELQSSGPANFNDAFEWCKELDDYLTDGELTTSPDREGSLLAVSKRLSVNPDLLSVVSFVQVAAPEGSSGDFRYHLELAGINQAGLLTYASIVFLRSGFTVVCARISTIDGQFSDTFELSTTSTNAEQLLRHYLDVPSLDRRYSAALPFQITGSDANLLELVGAGDDSPNGSQADPVQFEQPAQSENSTPRNSRNHGVGAVPHGVATTAVAQENNEVAAQVGEALALEPPPRKNSSGSFSQQQTTVQFQNGDVYSGGILYRCGGQSQATESRHGFGTYTYSSHTSFSMYRGHWHEDKKHGYGVLFYRNGGVYAGQWENNQKHGLGVLLDSVGREVGPNDIPSYRYEGLWYQDLQHGLGVEERSDSFFFGHFLESTRQGRGVHANTSKSGLSAYEAMDGKTRVPLLERLEREIERLFQSSQALSDCCDDCGSLEGVNCGFGLQNGSRADFATTAERASGDSGSGSSGPGSSGKNSCDTRTPMTPHLELLRSLNENQQTPSFKPGSQRSSVVFPQRRSTIGSSNGGARVALGPPQNRPLPQMSFTPGHDVEFALLEENNRLDESSDTITLTEPALEAVSSRNDNSGAGKPRALRQINSEPHEPIGGVTTSESLASSHHERRSTKLRTLSPLRLQNSLERIQPHESAYTPRHSQTGRTLLASPLLWSEDELAAFLACLGINTDVCRTVQQRSLKGATHILDMSNSEMRKQLGLRTPVERLVVRHSLKRLVEADRYEHHVRNQKTDLLGDSVLRGFLVPADELRVIGKISQGGFGTVFRAMLTPKEDRRGLQANKQHIVAAKEMKGERRIRLYELLKEANVMASLHHPNICTFIGICADSSGKKHYIVSELMDCSLFDLVHHQYKLRWHGDLSISLVVDVSLGICAGVTYLHNRNLVHADLKSSNILIDYSTSATQLFPRICDFGHAAVRPFPAPHHRLGTPHWAAPEALRSEALSPAADVYSFGVILWEMLTQKLPHRSLNFAQVLAAVGWAGWTPDLADLPEVPSELRRLLKACFSFSSADRPTAKDVGRRLRRIPRKANVKAFQMLSDFVFGIC